MECESCFGTGHLTNNGQVFEEDCWDCDGTGWIELEDND